jgi:hypothetical protein
MDSPVYLVWQTDDNQGHSIRVFTNRGDAIACAREVAETLSVEEELEHKYEPEGQDLIYWCEYDEEMHSIVAVHEVKVEPSFDRGSARAIFLCGQEEDE